MLRDPRTGRICEVHHRIPVHRRPDLACDPENLVTLLPAMHKWAGHPEGWQTWNSKLDLTCEVLKECYRQTVTIARITEKQADEVTVDYRALV